MLLHLDPTEQAPVLAAHLTSFDNPLKASRWRSHARRHGQDMPGLVFAKAMPFIGSLSSGGFGVGVPAVGSQALLTAWQNEAHFGRFIDSSLHRELEVGAGSSGWLLFEVSSTRGTHLARSPLVETRCEDGLFGALTLGRTTPRRLAAFLAEGARLGRYTHSASGLVAAFSAGVPLTGNCTVSLWSSESDMQRFAYGDPDGHSKTIRRNSPILTEQLNARLRLRRIGGSWDRRLPHAERLLELAAGAAS